jgi:hypothetical protein
MNRSTFLFRAPASNRFASAWQPRRTPARFRRRCAARPVSRSRASSARRSTTPFSARRPTDPGPYGGIFRNTRLLCGRDGRHGEQLARVRNVRGSIAVGEQRHHMQQEAPDELVGRQRHRLVPARPRRRLLYPSASNPLISPCYPQFATREVKCQLVNGTK